MDKKEGLEYYLHGSFKKDEVNDRHISLIQPSVSGGRITVELIDEIKNFPNANEIRISGLTQENFNYFIDSYGQQFKVIEFWKCPLISDLTKLEQLSNVEYLIFFWNQRATHLWDLSKNLQLKGLSFDDFTRMHTLAEIPLAPVLEELNFGDKVWNKYVLESLEPLCEAKKLKSLIFSAKKIEDNDITPLSKICSLERLEFPTNLFTTEQVAWLTANTKNVNSSVLAPYLKVKYPNEYSENKEDVIVIGKRKPFLNSLKDRTRLDKYEKDFWGLVEKYREREI
jgi:hypothetical protein